MSTFSVDLKEQTAQDARFNDDDLMIKLNDGRTRSVPLAWFPRLFHATPVERANWRWVGRGIGIHWPDLDEDTAIDDLILGRPTGEGQQSLRQWLDARAL